MYGREDAGNKTNRLLGKYLGTLRQTLIPGHPLDVSNNQRGPACADEVLSSGGGLAYGALQRTQGLSYT